MRIATVVLPVPGLPVKLMCSEGFSAARPRFRRSLSITSSAAISRMRCLTGARPTRSRSSSSSTVSTWLRARTSATVRAAAVSGCAVASPSGPPDATTEPGMAYAGWLISARSALDGHAPSRQARDGADRARRSRDPPATVGRQFGPHRIDDRLVVRLAENGAAGDKDVGAGIGHAPDVAGRDATIDLDADVAP